MNPLKPLLLSGLCLMFCFSALQARPSDDDDVKNKRVRERIFVGGYVGLQFGDITVINISPTAGYRISNKFSAGLNGTYQYYRERSPFFNTSQYFITHIYGGSTFVRYHFIKQAFAHAEYEALNLETRRIGTEAIERTGRFWEYNPLLGGGYRQALGARTHLNIMLLYNFNQDSKVYYQNPIFRIGVDVAL